MPEAEVIDYVEEVVGPVGSRVRVEVKVRRKGRKRALLRLLGVMKKERWEEIVFEAGPGARREDDDADGETDDDLSQAMFMQTSS